MAGNPQYLTYSSSGLGPWIGVDTSITPPYFAWAWSIRSTSAGSTSNGDLKIEWTPDDPFAYGSSLGPAPGGLAVSQSSRWPLTFTVTAMSSLALGVATLSNQPIYAWRINQQSSGFTVDLTFLQAGKKQ